MSLQQDLQAAFKKAIAKKLNAYSFSAATKAVKREASQIAREKTLQGVDANGKRIQKSEGFSKWKAHLLARTGKGEGGKQSGLAKQRRLKRNEQRRLVTVFWNTIGFISQRKNQ